MGAITSIGNNVDEYWNNLIAGKCGIDKITRIDVENHDTVVAAQVDDTFETLAKKLTDTSNGAVVITKDIELFEDFA